MPIYNAAPYLSAAINSIISQTFQDWELIVVDDGSTDNSLEIAQDLATYDKRIKAYACPHSGVATTANYAIAQANGQYVARMDADDIAFPQRLAKQLKYLQHHQDKVAVGGQCVVINEQGETTGRKIFPTTVSKIKEMMFYYYPLQQPSLMVNTALLPSDFIWYSSGLEAAEEHELLFKLLQFGEVVNMSDFLLFYRIHPQNTTKINPKRDFWQILKTRIKGVYHYKHLPSIKAVLFTFGQLLTVGLLPQKLIYPIYLKLRGLDH
jgi:glycosyltransferase involved in cell wall biosynthesis